MQRNLSSNTVDYFEKKQLSSEVTKKKNINPNISFHIVFKDFFSIIKYEHI